MAAAASVSSTRSGPTSRCRSTSSTTRSSPPSDRSGNDRPMLGQLVGNGSSRIAMPVVHMGLTANDVAEQVLALHDASLLEVEDDESRSGRPVALGAGHVVEHPEHRSILTLEKRDLRLNGAEVLPGVVLVEDGQAVQHVIPDPLVHRVGNVQQLREAAGAGGASDQKGLEKKAVSDKADRAGAVDDREAQNLSSRS